ncbi:hypothetical protein FRC15_008280, partial [Serendipita sp. 397]
LSTSERSVLHGKQSSVFLVFSCELNLRVSRDSKAKAKRDSAAELISQLGLFHLHPRLPLLCSCAAFALKQFSNTLSSQHIYSIMSEAVETKPVETVAPVVAEPTTEPAVAPVVEETKVDTEAAPAAAEASTSAETKPEEKTEEATKEAKAKNGGLFAKIFGGNKKEKGEKVDKVVEKVEKKVKAPKSPKSPKKSKESKKEKEEAKEEAKEAEAPKEEAAPVVAEPAAVPAVEEVSTSPMIFWSHYL